MSAFIFQEAIEANDGACNTVSRRVQQSGRSYSKGIRCFTKVNNFISIGDEYIMYNYFLTQ